MTDLSVSIYSAAKRAIDSMPPLKLKALRFRFDVIRPVLEVIERDGGRTVSGNAAEELLLGTAIKESQLKYRRQLGGGPALGFFQMEPATHDDIWQNYLSFRKPLKDAITRHFRIANPDATLLEHNDEYAAIMARIHYLRAPTALPAAGDLQGQAEYWKTYYNTAAGKGTVAGYIAEWRRFMRP